MPPNCQEKALGRSQGRSFPNHHGQVLAAPEYPPLLGRAALIPEMDTLRQLHGQPIGEVADHPLAKVLRVSPRDCRDRG